MSDSSPLVESTRAPIGWWRAGGTVPTAELDKIRTHIGTLRSSVAILRSNSGWTAAPGGSVFLGGPPPSPDYHPLFAWLNSIHPSDLGDRAFLAAHGLKYPYMTGSMANGIGSVELVEAMSRAGMLGSFGAAGLSVERVTQAIDRLQGSLGDRPYCFNLIHSPNEPGHESAVAELFLRRGVSLIEASAYLDLTPPIVRYRVAGLRRGEDGKALITNRLIAKASRVEVATKFFSPAPARIVQGLLTAGHITEEQAQLAATVPMCDDLVAEADSGGHTDNRPAITLFPTMTALRDRLQAQFGYRDPIRVGAAGGIATPGSAAAAFAMGAAFVVTGSINQACVESGSSDLVRKMLAEAGQADTAMAPAADMFEMGVKVQVLKRGTMFAMRAQKLFDLYRQYPDWQSIPAAERTPLEKNYFRGTFEEVWAQTREFFLGRDPVQVSRAESEPKHKMALVFRWYLGLSSRWANAGEVSRQVDYQVWCGPAMGAFNEWAKGSFLEQPQNRTVVAVALNLLYGACVQNRRMALRGMGVILPEEAFPSGPIETNELKELLK